MAHLIPPEPGLQTASRAERTLFAKFEAEVDDGWTILHSVGISGHQKKSWAEIDFVAVGPSGIFCLEVKGGRIARKDGQWIFTRGDGQQTTKTEGPFEQVGTAEAQLRRHLRDHTADRGASGRFAIGWGVITPDIDFDVTGPDIEPSVVYDARDTTAELSRYLARVSDYWHRRLSERWGHDPARLTTSDVDKVVNALRPNFDFRPSLRARMGLARQEMVQLTDEQTALLDDWRLNDRMIVMGAAGTGKTLLAVEEARHHARVGRRVLLCCYSAALAAWLEQAMVDYPQVKVVDIQALMNGLIDQAGLRDQIPDADATDQSTLFVPQVALDAIDRLGLTGSYDVLLVDEAQDLLRDTYLDVLELLLDGGFESGRWRMYYDPKQNVFKGVDTNAFPRLEAHRPASVRLRINCRNTTPIATVAALLAARELDETLKVGGPDVEQHFYRDAADLRRQVSRFINRLHSQGTPLGDIVVLSRYALNKSAFRAGLVDSPFRLTDHAPADSTTTVRFSTTAEFKGLESDVIVLVEVDNLDDYDSLSSIYVGASRARLLLGVFLDEAVQDAYQRRAEEFGERLRPDADHES